MTEQPLTAADLAEIKRRIREIEASMAKLRQVLEVAARRGAA